MKLYAESEQPKPQPEPVPEEPKPFSYRFKNWWYYHKWYVICGVIAVGVIINIVGNALGLWTKKPDFQIAYVGEAVLPDDTVAALENAFAELGGDFNGDGEAIVKLNQYIISAQADDPEAMAYSYSSEVLLMGDISACESYFFLTDDPEYLQRGFEILANPDGTPPANADTSVEDKVILWTDCGLLNEMELGSYTALISGSEVSGENKELVAGLSLGRRFFNDKKTVDCLSQCDELWDRLVSTVNVQN